VLQKVGKKSYLFVYGSLKREFNHPLHKVLQKYASFIADGFVYGDLYEISWYPGIKLSKLKKSKVFGELYLLKNPKKVLPVLDEYEGCSLKFKKPWEYRRVKTEVFTKKGKFKAWIYEYQLKVDKRNKIKSGIF